MTKILLEKLLLPRQFLSNFIVIEEPISLTKSFNQSVLLGQFYTFIVLNHPQASGMVKCTNDIIKPQLAKFVKALQIFLFKSLPLVLLNLKYILFGTHKFSFFETVIGHPMH